jgi:hypothetical protein
MARTVDRRIARRAVDSWSRQSLPGTALPSLREVLRTRTRNTWRAYRALRRVLISAILASHVTRQAFCRDRKQGGILLAARFRALSGPAIEARIRELEEKTLGNDKLRERYARFIQVARGILDPDSPEPAKLLQEICLELELSPEGGRVPWMRRS